ncbi:MAG: hypothetical protein AABW71_00420 [Nanoarchaeota archaeon]
MKDKATPHIRLTATVNGLEIVTEEVQVPFGFINEIGLNLRGYRSTVREVGKPDPRYSRFYGSVEEAIKGHCGLALTGHNNPDSIRPVDRSVEFIKRFGSLVEKKEKNKFDIDFKSPYSNFMKCKYDDERNR